MISSAEVGARHRNAMTELSRARLRRDAPVTALAELLIPTTGCQVL
jgi:hypothetical protein